MDDVADTLGEETRDLDWYAGALDAAASSGTRYEMSAALRRRFNYHVYEELPADAPTLAKAACWAIDYAAEIGNTNAKLVPRHFLGDRTDPPNVKDVDEHVATAWRDMLPLVESHPARARLAHLLFQRGGAGGREMAAKAIDAYSRSAIEWQREADAVEDLRVANRIARAIRDDNRAAAAIKHLLDAVRKFLTLEPPIPGVVISALAYAIADPDCPDDVDQILEHATQALPRSDDRDRVLQLVLDRCADDECRQRIWRCRVDAYIDGSEHAESEIARVLMRQKALQVAEESGVKELRQHAASVLQAARERDLELIRFEASSTIYNEHFEQYRDRFVAGEDWQQALISFAKCGPLNGDTKANRQHVAARRELGPIQAQIPVHIFGPGNLPYFSATTDEERFEFDLIKVEEWHVQGIVAPLIAALHEIPNRFGLPSTQELAQFLHSWPGIHLSAVPNIVIALQRFWAGDSHGAVYTSFPTIESLIRELLLRIDYGMYALAQAQRPGQYPALGPLIDALAGRFTISESGVRFLKILLNEPAGLNIRNQLAHGIENYSDPGTAALLIHTALFVGTLEPVEQLDNSTSRPDTSKQP